MFRKNDWEEVCQNVNNRDLQVAGLWVLLFFFPLVLCTILYFPSSVQISTCKLYKWKNRRRAVFSQFFVATISCDNSEEKPLPYFKGTIKSMTIHGDRMRHGKRQQQELQ